MLLRSHRLLFSIPTTPGVTAAQRVTRASAASSTARPSFHQRGTSSSGASKKGAPRWAGARHHHGRSQPGRTLRPGEPLPPLQHDASATGGSAHSSGQDEAGYTSQRQAYRRKRAAAEGEGSHDGFSTTAGVAGSYFTPFPKQYGFYDGLDDDAVEAPRPSAQERRDQLRRSLESQAASVVEFTEGGEDDVQLNGLPAEQYHGQAGWTTIPADSALYHTMYGASNLESRQRTNSWGVAMRHGGAEGSVGDLLGEFAVPAEAASAEVLDDRRRRQQHDESRYTARLEGELLAPTPDSVGQPRSTYALRKLFVDGLVGYQGMISRAEEAAVAEELMHLLQSRRAAYIAEEARYCVNLYEKELGIPGKDTLAFALSSCPTLQRVLYRFFFLGLIPAVPNVCQVSEMIGNFSGYPVHRHPRSIGSYVGLLNLVSTSVLHLQHKDSPWYPRLHLTPRSLFVVTEPCLSEYALGYKQTHQPFHTFEYATRVSKDYRIEVLFATVETAQTRTLAEAVQLTEYAAAKAQQEQRVESAGLLLTASRQETGGVSEARGSTDAWLQQLRSSLHGVGEGEAAQRPMDGHALRQQLLAQHRIGARSRGEGGSGVEQAGEEGDRCGAESDSWDRERGGDGQGVEGRASTAADRQPPSSSSSSSSSQRRMAALKARYAFAQNLKASKRQVEVSGEGPRLIRGHSPKDRHLGIK